MDQETLALLEFPQLLEIVQSFAHSVLGRAEVARLRPGLAPDELDTRVQRLAEAIDYASAGSRPDFRQLEDPADVVARLAVSGEVLQPKEFLLLLDLLKALEDARTAFVPEKWPRLAETVVSLPPLFPVIREIERIIDPAGEIRETADPELGKARRQQTRFREDVQEQLRGYFSGQRAKYLIQDPYITLRNGRYVIPVKLEHQRDLPGVVHGTSSSGATLFVEPFQVVELNNQYLYYQDREQEILQRILRRLTDRVRTELDVVREGTRIIAAIDAVFACASYAVRYHCLVPRVHDSVFRLAGARHPLLLQQLGMERVVPISVELNPEKNVLVISGPNAGGKTVALKTIGLLSLMASAGLPVPADDGQIPLFASILADIGDHQSLEHHLSTFSAHILRLKQIMNKMETPALVLLDEVGAGTDPAHGAVLGISVVDVFRRRQAFVVATTHHQAIKQFASVTPGVLNASVELDEATLRPTYQLTSGVAGGSSGLEIAGMLGLPAEVIAHARTLLREQDVQAERYLAELRRELARVDRQRENLEQEQQRAREEAARLQREHQAELEAIRREAEVNLSRWTDEFHRASEHVIKSVKDRFEAARLRKELKQRQAALKEEFRRKITAEQTSGVKGAAAASRESRGDLGVGDQVYHSFFRKSGKLISVSGDSAVVEIDGKRISTRLDQLSRNPEQQPEKAPRIVLPPNVRLDVVEEAEPELNLVGKTIDEALALADKFLDRAFMASLHEVRIIHGFGTGRLKAAVASFLDEHPHVLKHQVEGGATVVSIRH